MSPGFEKLVSDFHEHATRDANSRLMCGLQGGLGKLPDPSAQASNAQVQSARALLERAEALDTDTLLLAKDHGFSDAQIAGLAKCAEKEIRERRHRQNLHPCVKQIDTLAGEYPASEDDPQPPGRLAGEIRGDAQSTIDMLEQRLAGLACLAVLGVDVALGHRLGAPAIATS